MKFTMTKIAAGLVLSATAMSAQAVLVDGSTLSIDAGSYFTMGGGTTVTAPGFSGQFIFGTGGLEVGADTLAQAPGSVDADWLFFGQMGRHRVNGDTTILSASGNTATLDFSNWAVSWAAVPSIPMGTGAWFNGTIGGVTATATNGTAFMVCGVDCGNGDTYSLLYSATVPMGDPSNFGGTQYLAYLTGTVAAPIPEASTYGMMLAGLGLVGGMVARRRKLVA